jgi:hypothetical protein
MAANQLDETASRRCGLAVRARPEAYAAYLQLIVVPNFWPGFVTAPESGTMEQA